MKSLTETKRPYDDKESWQKYIDEMYLPDPSIGMPWGDMTGLEKSALERLNRDGIAVVQDLFPGDVIDELRKQFEALVPQMRGTDEATADEKHWEVREEKDAYISTNQAIRDLPAYLDVASSPTLLRIAQEYLQRPFIIRRTQAIHQGLTEKNDYGSFQWHHDQCGPQFKMILLLTDVNPGGQHTQVARGTHKLRYPFERWNGWAAKMAAKEQGAELGPASRYTDEEVDELTDGGPDDILSGVGPAGSAILFDSNALHRGRRGLSAIRNTAVFMFSPLPGLKINEVQIRRDDLEKLPKATQQVFRSNPLLRIL